MRVKSSTLLETVVALTLITFMFGMATSVFVGLTKNNLSSKEIAAEKVLENYRNFTHSKQSFYNEQVVEEGFRVERFIEDYEPNRKLIIVKYSVFDEQHKLLGKQRELVMKTAGDEED